MTFEQVRSSVRNALSRVRVWSGIPDQRLRRLREFSVEILAPVASYVNRGLLRPQEASFLFLGMALFILESCSEKIREEEDLIRIFGHDAVEKIREAARRYEIFEEDR